MSDLTTLSLTGNQCDQSEAGGAFHLKAGVHSNLWSHMNHNKCLWKTSGAPVPELRHAV